MLAPAQQWNPPPPPYAPSPPVWAQQQAAPYAAAALGPPMVAMGIVPPPPPLPLPPPPPLPPPGLAVVKPGAKKDGWLGQPTTTAIVGNRGAAEAESMPSKNHCVMCLKAFPLPRLHLAWECPIKLARRAGGEPCPGFDAQGNRVTAAWTADGNLQPATVLAWVSYIDRWGLEVAASAPGPPRLS